MNSVRLPTSRATPSTQRIAATRSTGRVLTNGRRARLSGSGSAPAGWARDGGAAGATGKPGGPGEPEKPGRPEGSGDPGRPGEPGKLEEWSEGRPPSSGSSAGCAWPAPGTAAPAGTPATAGS